MDSITHIVFGAVTGSAIAGKKLGKKAMLWGAIANSIPDIDVISGFWMNDPDAMMAHRGFTHSILFAFLCSSLLSWLFAKYHRNKSMFFGNWMAIFLSGLLFHITIDSMTTYGTGLFEPFSHERVSFNNIFVADPFFTISLLLSTVALLIIRAKSSYRFFWIRLGLICSSAYVLYTFINKFEVNSLFKEYFASKNISTQTYFCSPAPLNNWLWMGMAKDHDSIYVSYYSVFDKTPISVYQAAPVNDFLLNGIRTQPSVKKVLALSQGYYTVNEEKDTLVFSDARFGLLNGWQHKNEPPLFVFRFDIVRKENDSIHVKQSIMPPINGRSFDILINRIKGE